MRIQIMVLILLAAITFILVYYDVFEEKGVTPSVPPFVSKFRRPLTNLAGIGNINLAQYPPTFDKFTDRDWLDKHLLLFPSSKEFAIEIMTEAATEIINNYPDKELIYYGSPDVLTFVLIWAGPDGKFAVSDKEKYLAEVIQKAERDLLYFKIHDPWPHEGLEDDVVYAKVYEPKFYEK